jgi:hypothetical protein
MLEKMIRRGLIAVAIASIAGLGSVIAQQPLAGIQISLAEVCHFGVLVMNPHGDAPDYDVSLTDDGKVVYRARRGMAELSSLQYRVTPDDVRTLATEFEQAGFFELAPRYNGGPDHGCDVTVTLAAGPRQHVVRSSLSVAPDPLARLVRRVEAVARVDRFYQKADAGSDPSRPSLDLGVFDNLLERITWLWPQARELQDRLKATEVSTPEAAERLAWSAFNGRSGGVRSDEVVQLSGLYEVGRAIEGFADPQDLVWEARLWRGTGISDVIWVSTRTGAVLRWAPAGVTRAPASRVPRVPH